MLVKRGLVFLMLMLAATMASANFGIETTIIKDTIMGSEQAQFQIKISNHDFYADTFRIRAPEIFWSVQSMPLFHYFSGIDIRQRDNGTVTLLVNPIGTLPSGQYRVEVDIESVNTGDVIQEFLLVNIKPSKEPVKEYQTAITKSVVLPAKIDPRQKIPIRIELNNRNPKEISELQITGHSSLMNFETKSTLKPLERKIIRLETILDKTTSPQKDTITWSFVADGQKLDDTKLTYEIVGYSEIKDQTLPPTKELLKTTYLYTYFNDGNEEGYRSVELPVYALKRPFTSVSPTPFIVSKPEGTFMAWDLKIGGQKKEHITVTEDYRIILYMLTTGIVLLGLYYVLRSPVKIRKEAAVIGIEHDGITDIKVILHVKNRTSKVFDKITITDRVPSIATVVKDAEVGTLRPTKTVSSKDASIIKWEMDQLEKNEERVFSYTIKSKLSILGTFTLPPATAMFFENNKEKKTNSNSVSVKV